MSAISHPSGEIVEIVGTNSPAHGRCCDMHDICGTVIKEDVVVRLRKMQVLVEGKEETTIAVYWVTDGIDMCRVGFLPRHMVKHADRYDGVLAQVTSVYSSEDDSPSKRRKFHHNKGCCVAAIISKLQNPPKRKEPSNSTTNTSDESNKQSKPN